MAVLQMQRIHICALKKQRKQILELLQRLGVIELREAMAEDDIFHKADVSMAKPLFEKNISLAREALQILETCVPEKKAKLSMLKGRNEVSTKTYDAFYSNHDAIVHTANHICMLTKQIAEDKAEILKLQAQKEMLFPWTLLDIPMNFTGTKCTASFIGTLPNNWTLEMIYEQLAEMTPLNVDIISSTREQTCIFVLCAKEKRDAVSDALRAIGFSQPASSIDKAPAEQIRDLDNQIADTNLNISVAEEEIKAYSCRREDLQFLEDYDTMRAEKYEVISHLVQSSSVVVMTGYIPEIESASVYKELNNRFEVAIEFEQPGSEEEVPVLLRNNGFSKPLEGTVEAFSPPGKGETDPTMAMSIFYYMFFGLMLSDAAYGAIIALACGTALLKFKNTLEDSMKNTLTMYFFCGISTIFWGVMFGSYFGDIVDVVSATYFGQKISIPPLWFFPVNEPMRMLVFSMFLGIIHLYTGLGMKLHQHLRQKEYKTALYDVILWYVLLTSSILILLSMKLFVDILGLKFILPAPIGNIASIFAILSAIGITLTNGRESRNPFKRFLKGLYALYNITGYLSDVLSYSRLLALGLATGVICTVINKMASMAAGGPLGMVLFILILVLGHTLNIGINALGAYVHTNRLQYVEFFGKFYEGGGRKFNPFSVKTKYYKFKEELKNE